MPFRSMRYDIHPDKPQCVLTAGADDVSIQIRSKAFGGIQASSGFTFIVGGPDLESDVRNGFSCFSGEFDSDVSEGDEVWVASEPSEFQPATPITVLVRSSASKKAEEDKPESGTVKVSKTASDWQPPEPVARVTPEAPRKPRGQPAR